MDTRSRKWTNKVLITLVMIAMTLSGIYGLDTINNMAVTGDNSFSLDEQDQSDYIKNTQMSLFDKWADQEGDKVYYTQANHVSESLLNKIKKESFVKVTMKVKPYDKKMVTTTSTYGTENANYTGGRIEHFHIERGKTEKLNKDGSFKGLCARGGIELDANWKNARIENTELRASVPAEFSFRITNASAYNWKMNKKAFTPEINADGSVQISMNAGDKLTVSL